MALSDTIAATATAFGEGAIALLRLSGPNAVAVAQRVFRGGRPIADVPSHRQVYGAVFDGERKLDDVLLSVHRGPHSYTGDDVVELTCHGGILVTRRILEALLRAGARSAEPGEFTQRAFLNGKLDLTQAEAVMDLISAQSDLALRAASEQLAGRLGERIRDLRERLLEALAHVEAFIDFPEEDIDPETGSDLLARLAAVREDCSRLLATAGQGRVVREGVRTVIYGEPNVGKSTLLNLLLGYDRAIVSTTPGTTRDTLEEVIDLRGIPLRLVDTAGVRPSADELEQAGIARTHDQVARADLVLHLHDASRPRPAGLALLPRSLCVLNKVDLGEDPGWAGTAAVRLSCLAATGTEALAEAIEERVLGGSAAQCDWSVAINVRHQEALQRAAGYTDAAVRGLQEGISPEFVAEELRDALEAVGDIAGRVDTEDLLDRIFARFCIGK